MFDQLDFQGFRGFTELSLRDLGRVNLVVGRNNSGKTSLLEGITLLCDPARLDSDLPGLFRAKVGDVARRFDRWIVRDGSEHAALAGLVEARQCSVVLASSPKASKVASRPDLRQLPPVRDMRIFANQEFSPQPCRVVSIQHRPPDALNALFGRAVASRGGEERLEQLLRTVDGRVKKVRAVPGDDGTMLMVDLGLSEMMPLSQAGQGLSRLVAIFAELVGEHPKVCLIDEIENGIHHSVLPEVWRGIDAASRQLGVQVFATTHSHECIEAAHEAFAASTDYGLRIVQLFRIEQGPQGRVLDREHIEAALAGKIDLR